MASVAGRRLIMMLGRLWRSTDIGLHRAEICADSYRVHCLEHGVVAVVVLGHGIFPSIPVTLSRLAWLAMNCSKVAVSKNRH